MELRQSAAACIKSAMQASVASTKLVTTDAPVYLDGFSTTPLAPEARAALIAALDTPGNASSPHAAGYAAARWAMRSSAA